MNAPWLRSYDPEVPHTIGTYPEKTLVDFVSERARAEPDASAVVFKGRHLSWRQIDQLSDALANGLESLGVGSGSRVALLLPNSPQFVIAEMAVWKLGGTIAPQNPIYTARELSESLTVSEPSVAIVLSLFYERIRSIQHETSLRTIVATNIKEYLPPLLRILFTLVKEKKEGHRAELTDGDHWLQDLIALGAKTPRTTPSRAKPDDPAILLMSGGTTGTPKAALSDHRGMVMAGTQLAAWFRDPISAPGASLMLPLPLFHTYGCAGAQSMSFVSGMPLILVPNARDIDDLLKSINRDKPALFCGVPSLFNAMIAHPSVEQKKVDLSSIRACFSGAAALMAETKRRFEELTGGRIVEGYSLTEATMACFVNPFAGTNKIGSVGLPLPDISVRIRDAETGEQEMPVGEVGEIVIDAPQIMRGYWNEPGETAETVRTAADGTRWLHTGDLGYLDDDGYLFIVDRKKDLIKAGGFQVWPREIEEVIAAHPAVAEVGVAGVPDAMRGETIHAWVVPRGGATIDTGELREYCRTKLAPYKIPAKFEIRSELPKTMVGKVLRRVLVAEQMAK
jgi:long-chain acyl-CoA synthetase